MNIKLSSIYLKNFVTFHKSYKKDYYSFYCLKGGRGSGKTAQITIDIILDIIKNPISQLVIRKVGNTLGMSVYENLIWAIEKLGVSHLFSYRGTKTEKLLLTYIPRGNRIYFRGADNPKKIKGMKDSKFPIARLWIEELDEFGTEEEVSTITNSIIREKLTDNMRYKVIYSYNPPKRKHSWINKKFEDVNIPGHYFVDRSDYTTNKHLSDQFLEEADHIKSTNNIRYRWEYLGEPIGSGVVPFDNLEFREITNDEIKSFDNIKQGLDWGYASDPAAFVRLHYDRTRRKIYIFGEIEQVKLPNMKLAEMIKARKWNDQEIIADSSEPKSIDNLKHDHGIRNIRGAKKGPGSVESGEKWLDELEAIVIDNKRCPNTAREFQNIDYETDKNGNVLNRLIDKDNHIIDSVRYACEKEMVNKRRMILRKPQGF